MVQSPIATTCQSVVRAAGKVRPVEVNCTAVEAPAPPVADFKRGDAWEVHKFGGTCVSAAERIRDVAKVMIEHPAERKLMVVSAMGTSPIDGVKVTDQLLNVLDKAVKRDNSYVVELEALDRKHQLTAEELLGQGPELDTFMARLKADISDLSSMLKAISIAGVATEAFSDFVVGHGEIWNAQMMSATIRALGGQSTWLDAREVLIVNPTALNTNVDYPASDKKLDEWFAARKSDPASGGIIVATGFVASTPNGVPTTLKRNGSDYSATIMGALFRSQRITIWTDVKGVYSADPRKVSEAVCLDRLTYHEAWELSYFGANVLHPATTLPAMKYGIPITIRNFFELDEPGTDICDAGAMPVEDEVSPLEGNDGNRMNLVKGFATIDDIALITVEGTGLVGVPGTASAIFQSVRDAGVNVNMISQASSEHSVCFAVKSDQSQAAVTALNTRFKEALSRGRIARIEALEGCSILAAVGQQMSTRHGTCATLFSALAKASINVRCIAQGASEYNVTMVIDQKDSVRALRAVHSRFFLSETPIAVGIVGGVGLVGKTLMKQFLSRQAMLHDEFNIDMRVVGVMTSKKMMMMENGLDLATWEQDWEDDSKTSAADMDEFTRKLKQNSSGIPNCVMIDCTASDAVSDWYVRWLEAGVHVITPNKKVNSGPLDRYKKVRQLQRDTYTHYFSEATVGAGLPIISTLRGLVETGDHVRMVEGVFSGTLSYIFNTMTPSDKFSEVVGVAKAQGFTEPDPRDDLSGTDVARKVVTLARESGLMLELEDLPVDSLVPEPLQGDISTEDFMARLPEFDADMAARMQEADDAGEVLRLVGVVDVLNKAGRVELRRYPKSHPFAQLQGSDNIISFTTDRYLDQPLIVRGPGAGAEVTAGGVFADLLRLCQYIGCPS